MATFKIHEDICNYVTKNKNVTIKLKPKALKDKVLGGKASKIPTKRLPLRVANAQVKKDPVPCEKVIETVKAHKDPERSLGAISQQSTVRRAVEIFQDSKIYDDKELEKEEDYFKSPQEIFYFSRDQHYFTSNEYHRRIYAYLKKLELSIKETPRDTKIKQPEITPKMRSILVDWLSSVTEEYNMQPQTLHLAVQYVDRFMKKMYVLRNKFQLVGTAAMMIAAKYEEIYPPDTKEWSYLAADCFTTDQLLRMEILLLNALKFEISKPTAFSFISHICYVCDLPKKIMLLALYLSELALLEGSPYSAYLPSQLASSSVALARYTLDEEVWPKELETKTGYSLRQLSPIIKRQNDSFKESPKKEQQAIQNKFKTPKYGGVALFTPKEFPNCDIMEE